MKKALFYVQLVLVLVLLGACSAERDEVVAGTEKSIDWQQLGVPVNSRLTKVYGNVADYSLTELQKYYQKDMRGLVDNTIARTMWSYVLCEKIIKDYTAPKRMEYFINGTGADKLIDNPQGYFSLLLSCRGAVAAEELNAVAAKGYEAALNEVATVYANNPERKKQVTGNLAYAIRTYTMVMQATAAK